MRALESARLTLKQHRFEVAAGVVASVMLGAAALWIASRLNGLGISQACVDAWLGAGGIADPACDALVQAFATIDSDEAGKVMAAMAILPFAVGLLAGVPIVGRELEARTAQTAWALAGSRVGWLGRQVWPVLLATGLAVGFAAAAATVLQEARSIWSSSPLQDDGLYGVVVVARWFAAFSLGLLVGAALGRTLPAFIVGAVLALALVYGGGMAQSTWLQRLPSVILEQEEAQGGPQGFDGILLEQAWRTPEGAIITEPEAIAVVPDEGAADPYQWLIDRDYQVVVRGVTGETLRGWMLVHTGGFALVGLGLLGLTVLVVDRRRPV